MLTTRLNVLKQCIEINKLILNAYSTRIVLEDAHCLNFEEVGDPTKVIKYSKYDISKVNSSIDENGELKDGHVLVKNIASPINPADINYIQGIYGIKPKLPCIGGFEGIGKVTNLSSSNNDLQIGDIVAYNIRNKSPPGGDSGKNSESPIGTWCTHNVLHQDKCLKVPHYFMSSKQGILTAATMSVNTCTAYRMLYDFVNLKPGDCIIQNGATSAVGQSVIQISKAMGVSSINVIRSSTDENIHNARVEYLKSLGADYVITEEFLGDSRGMSTFTRELSNKPRLFLNCVGGRGVTDGSRSLQQGSTIVTYGGMSMKPIAVGAGPLIFKDLRYRGFWMTEWNKKCNENDEMNKEREQMWTKLGDLFNNKQLRHCKISTGGLDDFAKCLDNIKYPGSAKQVFVMDPKLL